MDYSFCIDKKLLGTESHILCRKGSYQWVDEVPSYAWWLDGNLKVDCDSCLDTLLMLNGIDINVRPPDRFVLAMETVLSGSAFEGEPPWKNILPDSVHKTFMKGLLSQVIDALKNCDTKYYRTVWVPGNRLMRALKRAKVNVERYNELVEADVGNVNVVKTFKAQQGGYAASVVYDRFGTRTGRLTVKSGPSMLTLRKDYRDIVSSRYGDKGRIVMLDFRNLEPRILLYEAGKRCDDPDLYNMLNSELFSGAGDRKLIKGAVISVLYGTNKYVLMKKLGVSVEVIDEFLKRIRTYFEAKKLLKRVKDTFIEKGYIENRYGRRVEVDEPADHIFINSYAQSTGADVATLGFDRVLERIGEDRKVTPVFLLVDAIILDVHEDEIGYLGLIKDVTVPGYVQSFPLKMDIIA